VFCPYLKDIVGKVEPLKNNNIPIIFLSFTYNPKSSFKMKKLCILLIVFISSLTNSYTQIQHTINGQTLTLHLETEGTLDFLSYTNKDERHLFIRDQNDSIIELINTKDIDNTYFQEYKEQLEFLTKGSNMSADDVSFGVYSIKQFIKAYNSGGLQRYAYTGEKVKAKARVGFFGGLTNIPFIENLNNKSTPFFSGELEFFQDQEMPRQTGYFAIKQTSNTNDIQYQSTQLALGYRFRFINQPQFNIHGNLEFAAFTFSKSVVEIPDEPSISVHNKSFRIPIIFGLGSDIRITDTSYITLTYYEIVSVLVDNNGHFPVDFGIGYKFDL